MGEGIDRTKRTYGRAIAVAAGPIVGAIAAVALHDGSSAGPAAAAVGGIALWMAIWWMTEALPLAATALLPIVLIPLVDLSAVPHRVGSVVGVAVDRRTVRAEVLGMSERAGERFYRVRPTETASAEGSAETPASNDAEIEVPAAAVSPWGRTPGGLQRAVVPYADKFIFLFLGGFIVARGIERWGLHRRIALAVLERVGTSPSRLVAGAMGATAAMSMWLSNTATTLVMLPVALSLIESLTRERRDDGASGASSEASSGAANESHAFRTAMLLGIAYAATWGGILTPIGTPPNALLMREMGAVGSKIGFAQWIAFALPLGLTMLVFTWWLLTRGAFRVTSTPIPGASEMLARSRSALGRMSPGERGAGVIFASVALAWIVREPLASWGSAWQGPLGSFATWLGRWDDATVAIAGAVLMFVWPVSLAPWRPLIDWNDAKGLPWDVLLLFGGGLSLSDAIRDSGLDHWIGSMLDGLAGMPNWLLVLIIAIIITFLTELTSNMATAALFLPLVASLGERLRDGGASPELLMVPAALAASCAFMLPVATPPNALVFAGGGLKIGDMVRAGLVLNLVSKVVITIWVMTAGRWMLGL